MFGLPQYEAALKLVEDFHLLVAVKGESALDEKQKECIRREKAERERILHIRKRFEKWCGQSIDMLKDCITEIDSINQFLIGKAPDMIFSKDYAQMLHAEPVINYWLDILCMGGVEEKQELFLKDRKKVEEVAGHICTGRKRIVERGRGSA